MNIKTGTSATALRKLDQIAPDDMIDIEGNRGIQLNKNFFARLFTSANEKNFIDGCKEIFGRDSRQAYKYFRQSIELADGAFMAGYFAFRFGENEQATIYFKSAINNARGLGYYFTKYDTQLRLKLSISVDINVVIAPDHRGAVLGLVEAYQKMKYYDEAINELRRLYEYQPRDYVVLLALIDMLYCHKPTDKENLKSIMSLSNKFENNSFIECAILLYRAKAQLGLGVPHGARNCLTQALSRRKDCPKRLRCALLDERATANKAVKNNAASNIDLQNVYAEDSDFKDIGQRLGI